MRAATVLALLGLLTLVLGVGIARGADPVFDPVVEHDFDFAETQLEATATSIATNRYPYLTGSSGAWQTTGASSWTSGFFPGSLWLMAERTGDALWRTRAQSWQAGIESQKTRTSTHDLGFMFMTSFGNGYRLTGNDAYRQVLVTAASSLATRFNATVGCIRSLNDAATSSDFRVIVDTMMNIELLFWAARNGGPASLYDKAVSHALRTRQDFVRSDGSTYQLVTYNATTGTVKSKGTRQGYNTESTWSRGQAWAVYGFAVSYRETGDPRFLETARSTADYFIDHLPSDDVPYWDFELPSTAGEPRDSSAAAITASALLELSELEPDGTRAARYATAAKEILTSLSSPAYLAEGTQSRSVLLHGTQNANDDNTDTGIVYGDYYFLQALMRYVQGDGGTPDETPPVVSGRSPVAGAVGVSVGSVVSVSFSEPVVGVSGSSFWLSGPGGVVPAVVSYEGSSRTAVLDPVGELAASTVYSATVSGGVTDLAGNVLSGAPVVWSFTTAAGGGPPPGGVTVTVSPVADTWVYQAEPSAGHAGDVKLPVVGSPSVKQAFLRFVVSGLPVGGVVESAKLRLTVVNDSTSGGIFSGVSSTSWPESITWATKPAIDGPVVATLGAVGLGVVEVDVTSLIAGNGTYSIAITHPAGNGNNLAYASREASNQAQRPQLTVTTAG